ncbi:MAG: Regulatory protein RecX [Chloroflexi bacterium ADurb.Bin222]|nr:MAG: Regulatory protein RecX [Chloroflexi bacterium ADurb.Bin222]
MPVRAPILDEEHAMQYALRLLGYRPRGEEELRRRLDRRGYPPPVTDRTLATLARLDLLDDREFARGWVTARAGRGPALLKQELRAKGIPRDVAEEIVSEEVSAEEEYARALAVARRVVHADEPPLDRDALLRVRRLLQRRGFSFGVIGRVCADLNDHLTEEGDWLE